MPTYAVMLQFTYYAQDYGGITCWGLVLSCHVIYRSSLHVSVNFSPVLVVPLPLISAKEVGGVCVQLAVKGSLKG